ncbi:fused DSP-PTPase phosphatase/NAD kinase-like protein [Indioceanicola profundi]|uniref:fused DSP-PTPase phosphatase/NAD kinase-like protein n=1 Tax=Indioceanicola profundi TaxID=2220096 RepID=UPI000E6ACDF1|nr:tyrosine-protein phosphatase [Indioceanicola profundi]
MSKSGLANETTALTPVGRRHLIGRYVNSIFKDHAFIRMVYKNMFRITDRMWRSSQPTPAHVEDAQKMGIKTIINLRGRRDDCGSYFLEERACRRHGVTLVDFPVNSRDAPKKENLHKAREIWNSIEYPALMHCKAGADRVGFMSALYLLVHEKRPVDEAMSMLHWRFGHVRQAKTGILDRFFEEYREYSAKTPIDFYDWVDNVYDPVEFKARFMSTWWANTITETILKRE